MLCMLDSTRRNLKDAVVMNIVHNFVNVVFRWHLRVNTLSSVKISDYSSELSCVHHKIRINAIIIALHCY